jgi:hypothetical protein
MILGSDGKITSLRWQLWLKTPQTGNLIGISGVEMRTAPGGSNLATTPGNAQTSPTGSNPGNAFDGNLATNFTSSSSGEYITYQFASPVSIGEIKVIARNDASFAQAPQNISVHAEDEYGQWPVILIVTGLSWTQGEVKTLPIANLPGADRAFRIRSSRFVAGVRLA